MAYKFLYTWLLPGLIERWTSICSKLRKMSPSTTRSLCIRRRSGRSLNCKVPEVVKAPTGGMALHRTGVVEENQRFSAAAETAVFGLRGGASGTRAVIPL